MKRGTIIALTLLGLGGSTLLAALSGSDKPRRRRNGTPGPSPTPAPGARIRTLADLGTAMGRTASREPMQNPAAIIYPVLGLADFARLVIMPARPEASERDARIYAAWADGESGLNPNMVGDTKWAERKPAEYRRQVLEEPVYAENPLRTTPQAWISYGYFQLLSAWALKEAIGLGFFAFPNPPPWLLANPDVNAAIGLAMIDRLLRENAEHGWPEAFVRSRLAAKGCGADGSRCSTEDVAGVRARALRYLEKWEVLSAPVA